MWRSLALISAFICTPLWAPAQALPPLAEPNATPNDPQVVAGPIPEKITSNSAVVWWETTKPTESILLYGTSRDDLTHRLQKPWPSQTHEASLKSLRPDTTYFLVVIEPNGSSLATAAFTTEPENYTHENTVRVTNGPLFEQITPESATIAWSTNVPSSSVIRYGSIAQNLDNIVKGSRGPTTHHVRLTNLQPDTRYFFEIVSAKPQDASSSTRSALYAFQTLSRGQQALNVGPPR